MRNAFRVARPAALLAATTLVAGALALWLMPRAIPIVALDQRLTRDLALQRADSFFRAHELAPEHTRTAVRFRGDDSLRVFVELAGGGKDTLDALVRGRDVAPFTWSVRAFVPGDPHEARVHFAPDGRVVGFQRVFAEADRRPALSPDSARALAQRVLETWLGEPLARWRATTSSYETRKTSERVDRTLTFERMDRQVGGAPLRLDVVIAGDAPASARAYVVIPETFSRRYGEMRSANQILALLATVGFLAIAIVGALALRTQARRGLVRWREAMIAGAVLGALLVAAGMNELPSSWYDYDTAMSPGVFQTGLLTLAIFGGALMGLIIGLTLTAAEAFERQAFPWHLDWWKLWKYRCTRAVAGRVFGGYTLAAVGFAYVAAFYVATRGLFGWWVPSELLDDPNQIATPMPWLGAVAISLQAGVWEEALFRALPLSLLSMWVGARPNRSAWMAAGVVATALVFGFAHASYASWPPYSRGAEIFLEACLWGVVFLRFGLLVTVVAHFVFDLVLFGLFAAAGTALEYRLTLAVIVVALLAPALAVAWKWVRQRGLAETPDEARLAAWVPDESREAPKAPLERPAHTLTPRARRAALATIAAGVLLALLAPREPVLGARFTASRERAVTIADSMMRARGVPPGAWKRLARTANDTLDAWPRFLREHNAEPLAAALARTYEVPSWWVVRYVRTADSLAQRAEEWRVRVLPDGAPLDVRHILPEDASGDSLSAREARRIARAALVRAGLDTSRLFEVRYEETARPKRRDATVVYTDSATPLPGHAAARVWVSLAGREPVLVRRGVELPEQFLRADRDRQQRRLVVSIVCGLALLTAIAVGTLVVVRRRPVLVADAALSRRTAVALVASLAVIGIAGSLNTLPVSLYSYDTATPWSTFVSTVGISVALSGIPALLFAGLWLVMNALRRRVGVPALPAESASGSREALLAGLALGAVPMVLERAMALAGRDDLPGPPTTLLDQAVPALAHVLSLPTSLALIVPLMAIPALAIAGLARRWRFRLVLIVVFLALAGGVVASAAARTMAHPGALEVLLAVATPVALVLAVRAWGALCATAWVLGALGSEALEGARLTLYAPTAEEQLAGGLSFALALALLGWLARHLARALPGVGPTTLTADHADKDDR